MSTIRDVTAVLLGLVLSAGLPTSTTIAAPAPTPIATATPHVLGAPLGKPAVKCQAAIKKAGLTFVRKKLQSLDKCVNGVSKCLQTKADDPGRQKCMVAAGQKCAGSGGAFATITAEAAKLVASIRKACEVKGLSPADLRSTDGLGFDAVKSECGSVATVAEIADCVAAQHACRAEQLFEVEAPRARELVEESAAAAGLAVPPLPCLHHLGDGGNLGKPKGAGKLVVQCESTIAKAGRKFVATKVKSLEKCVDAAFACIQTKAGAERQTCLSGKAAATCAKELGKIAAATRELAPTVDTKCLPDAAFYATALGPLNGANLTAPTVECAGVDADPASYAGYKVCLAAQHEARVDELLRLEVPRADELLALVGCTLDGLHCTGSGIGRQVTFAPPPVQDLAALGVPRLPDGRFFVFGAGDASLTVDPTLRNPVTALGACTRWITTCVDPTARSLDDCARSAPACTTDQPWEEDAPCCPAACFAAYEAARLAGTAPLPAFSQVYFTDASCFPGVRALLDGTAP